MKTIVDERPPTEQAREYNLLCLLQRVWTYAQTTKSDLTRVYADEIAEGSSRGFLTTQVVPGRGIYGRLWKITPTGLQWLYDNAERIAEEEVANYVESFVQHG
ncbi:MAG: hypothetical protein WA154_12965 [Moraxellaceae bacterium]